MIEKAIHAKASDTIVAPSYVLKSSRCGRKKKNKNKMVQWIKTLFGKCTYAVERAYETQLEQREMRADANLPPLPPPPPHYDLPSLSDTEDDDEDEAKEEFDYQLTLGSTLCSMKNTRHTRHTSTTHRQGRAVVSSDDNDNDGNDGWAARGGEDVDWENSQQDDEEEEE